MTEPLLVSELFYSLQGESTRAGLPCLFIRLAGCNLRCRYCDARYTWEEPGEAMTSAALLAWVEQFPGVMVELTGGEPLFQAGALPLLEQLVATDRQVLLETNGSLPVDRAGRAASSLMRRHRRVVTLASVLAVAATAWRGALWLVAHPFGF